ncbi:MAG TPA: hypothetical protein ENH11_03560, partial [Candidatus Acetothermia bacterium]|nr:hypothetical protein [Candidatus Acetothermia bacterium]
MESINGITIAIVLFGIGVFALIVRRDLVIKLLALGLIDSSSVLFLVSLNAQNDGIAPIVHGPAAN